jgi:hypothetical protein
MGKRGIGRAVNKWWQKWARTNRGSIPENKGSNADLKKNLFNKLAL